MSFDKNKFSIEELTTGSQSIKIRAFRNIIYVKKPVCEEYQQMNIFVPEIYFSGGSINGYNRNNAPVFMPNTVGGYMPGRTAEPGVTKDGEPDTITRALLRGYVTVVPALRGRTLKNDDGKNIGKAPACIVDYKCAVRFLRLLGDNIPGDTDKIITNGTSAGGALSALMGATGNHRDYEPYIAEIGGAEERDDVFAASCYCPITNLENADMAYEWEFGNLSECYNSWNKQIMNTQQIKASKDLSAMFTGYLNSLGLKDDSGSKLYLDENGNGTFKEYINTVVKSSAQRAIDNGIDVSDKAWLTVADGKVTDMDFDGYVKDITRMKPSPAFDSLEMDITENHLFGTDECDFAHFTKYSMENSVSPNRKMADKQIIRVMNPMNYISDKTAVTSENWRIRHGECDRDTSLAISAMLTLSLLNNGFTVDYHAPWNVPHAGDYDLDELFDWIDRLCKQ